MYYKFTEDHLWIMSASIAFNIIICIIPFILILLSIAGIYLNEDQTIAFVNSSLDQIVGITPELKTKITNIIISGTNEISRNKTITAIIGTVGILWTASSLISTLREVLNNIYKTKNDLFYVCGKFRDIAMVFLLIFFFILSFSTTFILQIFRAFNSTLLDDSLISLGWFSVIISYTTGLLFTFIMFYLIFKLVPQGYVNPKVAFISALSSSILSELLKSAFIVYVVSFANYQKIYGTYSAVVAVIFWLYYSSLTFVIGAEIGQLYREKELITN